MTDSTINFIVSENSTNAEDRQLFAELGVVAKKNGATVSSEAMQYYNESHADISIRKHSLDTRVRERFLVGVPEVSATVVHLFQFAGPAIAAAGGSAAFVAFLKSTKEIILKMLELRAHRSISLQVGDTNINVHRAEDLDRAISAVSDMHLRMQQAATDEAKNAEPRPAKNARARKKLRVQSDCRKR